MKHISVSGQVKAVLFALGVLSVLAQIVLFREMMFLSGGSEIVVVAVLFFWLAAGALGSFAGPKILRKASPARLLGLCALILPAEILAMRLVRGALSGSSGELPSLLVLLIFCSLVAAPLPAILGAVFPLAASGFGKRGAARAYTVETAGIIIGAFLTLALVSLGNEGAAVALVSCLFLMSAGMIMRSGYSPAVLALSLLPLFFVALGLWNIFENNTVSFAFGIPEIKRFASTPYGRAFSAHHRNKISIFSNGFSETPLPEADEIVELALAVKNNPETMLVLCNDPSGYAMVASTLPGCRTRIITPDSDILAFRLKEKPFEVAENVEITAAEPLRYLKKPAKSFDMIIISTGAPVSAQNNRFFTLEFFKLVKSRLNKGGIAVVKLPYSPGHVSKSLQALNGSVWKTLGEVFKDRTLMLSQSSSNMFLVASLELPDMALLPNPPLGRENARKMLGIHVPLDYKKSFASFRAKSALEALNAGDWEINTIASPVSCRHAISYAQSRFGSPPVLEWLWNFRLYHWIIAAALAGMLLLFVSIVRGVGFAPYSACFGGGFCSMVAQVVLLYIFQSSQGVLYSHLGLVVGAFMAGALAGALNFRTKNSVYSPVILVAGLAIFSGALPHLLGLFALSGHFAVRYALFPATGIVGGYFTGALFPACANLVGNKNAGAIYAADLSGACLGALLAGLVLIPSIGLGSTAVAAALAGVFLALPMLPVIISTSSMKNPMS